MFIPRSILGLLNECRLKRRWNAGCQGNEQNPSGGSLEHVEIDQKHCSWALML
jgi:hypothetical protein